MTKTLSVSAIHNGTVIDHIKPGNALRIIHLLGLMNSSYQITLGLNLPSKRIGKKDLIKIESLALLPEQANDIMVFAPDATINIVKDFEVKEKVKTQLPKTITEVFVCPNHQCISQEKNIKSVFNIEEQRKQVILTCHYCERIYNRDHVKVKI